MCLPKLEVFMRRATGNAPISAATGFMHSHSHEKPEVSSLYLIYCLLFLIVEPLIQKP